MRRYPKQRRQAKKGEKGAKKPKQAKACEGLRVAGGQKGPKAARRGFICLSEGSEAAKAAQVQKQ